MRHNLVITGSSPLSLVGWMDALISYVQSARPDLTNRQLALLLIVHLTPGPHTVRGLAAQLRVSKPVVTRALNTLGSLGYLRRQKDESDLRNVLVERTAQGQTFLDEFARLIEDVENHVPRRERAEQLVAH
jgi:DNA-binding MarR family transcriptional regulator